MLIITYRKAYPEVSVIGNGKHYSSAASNSSMSDILGCRRTFLAVSIIGIEDKPDSNDDIDTAALAEK